MAQSNTTTERTVNAAARQPKGDTLRVGNCVVTQGMIRHDPYDKDWSTVK